MLLLEALIAICDGPFPFVFFSLFYVFQRVTSTSLGDPFIELYTDITKYFIFGEVILLGYFNAHTRDLQIPLCDESEDVFCTQGIDPDSVGLRRRLDDALGPTTFYGKHLL